MDHTLLIQAFDEVNREIREFERGLSEGAVLPLRETVERGMTLVKRLMIAYLRDDGKKQPPVETADILDVYKILVKGDPSWNTIRDNCRELVYYRNCVDMDRLDALPKVPDKMTVRTLRHLYLFMRTRCIREDRIED